MIWSYPVIGIDLAVMALLAGWMFVTSRTHYLVRAGAAIAIVVMSAHIWVSANALRGYAVPGLPKDGDGLIGFALRQETDQIYFWIDDQKGPRVYVVPYTKELAKMLASAEDEAVSGNGRIVFRLKKGTTTDDGEGNNIKYDDNQVHPEIDVVPLLPRKK